MEALGTSGCWAPKGMCKVEPLKRLRWVKFTPREIQMEPDGMDLWSTSFLYNPTWLSGSMWVASRVWKTSQFNPLEGLERDQLAQPVQMSVSL